MKTFFKELFEYTHQYNCQLIEALNNPKNQLPGQAAKIFSHMLNAHNVWNTRLSGEGKAYGIWQLHEPASYSGIAENNYQVSLELIDKMDFDETITYTNSQGREFTNIARDMLFQVVNHSTYHRGQLAMMFRENGIEPLLTEYIFFKR